MPTASTPGAPLLARTFSHAPTRRRFPTSNDFRLTGFDLPVGSSPAGLASGRSDPSGPFTPAPLQGLHRYYGPVRPCAPHRYSAARGVRRLRSSLSQPGKSPPAITIGATGSPVPCQRLRRAHATSTPGTTRTATRLPPGPRRAPAAPASRGFSASPVLMPSFAVSMRHQWFTHVRLLGRTPDRSTRPFPQRSPPRLLTAAACGGLGPPPDRRSRRASLHHRHSTVHDNDLLHRHQSPFRTHRRFGREDVDSAPGPASGGLL